MLSVDQKQALSLNESDKPGKAVHSYSPSAPEIEAGDCKLQAQPGLLSEALRGGGAVRCFELMGDVCCQGPQPEPTPVSCPLISTPAHVHTQKKKLKKK